MHDGGQVDKKDKSMVLKPIRKSGGEVPYGSDSPILTCEICGKSAPSHLMINLMIGIGSPGHPSLTGFQCPGSGQYQGRPEHWACSLECWKQLAHACIDEHMIQLLRDKHDELASTS
jgi:hypothetical protein